MICTSSPDRVAQRLHQLHVQIHAARAVARAVPQEPFLVDEAVLLQAARRVWRPAAGSMENPRQLPYTRTGNCVGPPNKRNTGAPKCRPRRSHSALSM